MTSNTLLDDRREFHLPALVTPSQQHMGGGNNTGGGDDFGMFNAEFLRKVAFFGRIHQEDPSDAVGV